MAVTNRLDIFSYVVKLDLKCDHCGWESTVFRTFPRPPEPDEILIVEVTERILTLDPYDLTFCNADCKSNWIQDHTRVPGIDLKEYSQ